MGICAVIVTYNTGPDILKCFDSIRGQVDEVLIVDNGSNKETIDALNKLEKQDNVNIFYSSDNLGIAGALNKGVRYALDKNYEWIMLLDHDSKATGGMVRMMLEEYDKTKKLNHNIRIDILAPVPCDVNFKVTDVEKSGNNSAEAGMAMTSGSLIHSRVFNSAGFFNEGLFMYYVDDDFCIRVRKAGYKIFIVKQALLLHSEGRKEAKKILWKTVYCRNYKPIANYYIFRNGIYILKKYASFDRSYIKKIACRMCADLIKIALFSRNKFEDMKLSIKGLSHGIIGRYGKL